MATEDEEKPGLFTRLQIAAGFIREVDGTDTESESGSDQAEIHRPAAPEVIPAPHPGGIHLDPVPSSSVVTAVSGATAIANPEAREKIERRLMVLRTPPVQKFFTVLQSMSFLPDMGDRVKATLAAIAADGITADQILVYFDSAAQAVEKANEEMGRLAATAISDLEGQTIQKRKQLEDQIRDKQKAIQGKEAELRTLRVELQTLQGDQGGLDRSQSEQTNKLRHNLEIFQNTAGIVQAEIATQRSSLGL